ncbi:MAG: hypothetical protein C4523_19725 [Myxococcales bacterium]|nr:MAG: hypothetical protein C4523_19725 [Myxococcales bacterium]
MLPQTDEIRCGSTSQRVWFRPVLDNALVSAPSAQAYAIYAPSGALLSSGAASFDATAKILYADLDVSDAALWAASKPSAGLSFWYTAEFQYTLSSKLYVNRFQFALARDPWEPGVTTDDLLTLADGAQYLEGGEASPSMIPWIEQAEREIRARFRREFDRTTGFHHGKQDLDELLKLLALHWYWATQRTASSTMGDAVTTKAQDYLRKYGELWALVFANASFDDDQDAAFDDASGDVGTTTLRA